jgi:asparagine synthase (glutamine-hydrolysing)
MCGICGILNLSAGASPIERPLLERMTATLTHRGPDDHGYHLADEIGFGMRRLAIIDLPTGRQPIYNEDRSVVIVFNGEIYNFRELRRELLERGHVLATHSDTEVIVHLYEERGPACVEALNGMFAFAIWDVRGRTLLLARDRLGIKPLYYAQAGGRLIFGSELKALLAYPGLSRQIDPIALDQYMALRYVPAPRAIFAGVHKLPAGGLLICREGQIDVRRYWHVRFAPETGLAPADWTAETRRLLDDAVRRQMVSDVPLGAFLSGGIDSSAIVALMAGASSQPVRTFSVAFRDWPGGDESEAARRVARHLGTEHHELHVEADALASLPRLIDAFDEPMADPAALPTLLMCEAARREVTVVLTGEGADEIFAGYPWYRWGSRPLLPLPTWARRPLLRAVSAALRGRRGQRNLTSLLLPSVEERYWETIACSVFQRAERRRLFSADVRQALAGHDLPDAFAGEMRATAGLSALGRLQTWDVAIWLEGDPLTKADRMSMAVSLEARVPFLDHRLVEWAARIPPAILLQGGVGKSVLRRAVADLLPAETVSRPKHAFDVPIDAWLRRELRAWTSGLARRPAFAASGWFNADYVAQLTQEHLAGRQLGRQLWALLIFAEWYDRILRPA